MSEKIIFYLDAKIAQLQYLRMDTSEINHLKRIKTF